MNSLVRIPWAKPAIGEAEIHAAIDALESGHLTCGPYTEHFEHQMAQRVGRRHAIAVANGTAALDLAMRALGLSDGDEVIVPALGHVASAGMVMQRGATPVFTDVDLRNLNLDPARAAAHVSLHTRAVLCADQGGNPCDYGKLTALCERHALPLIVSGAESIGTAYEGRPTLGYGLISTTSFHAGSCFTTLEGGMVFTDDADIARHVRLMRCHGEDPQRPGHYIEPGHNFRMTEIQAAIGLAQLERLDTLLADREAMANRYRNEFAPLGLSTPATVPGGHNGWQRFWIMAPQRDRMAAHLDERGIETRVNQPMPLYRQPVFQRIHAEVCPLAEQACAAVLNLPMFFGLQSDQQYRIVAELHLILDMLGTDQRWRKAV